MYDEIKIYLIFINFETAEIEASSATIFKKFLGDEVLSN